MLGVCYGTSTRHYNGTDDVSRALLIEQGHNIARRGWGRKGTFPPFEVNKTQKSPVLGEVSQLILSPIVGKKGP